MYGEHRENGFNSAAAPNRCPVMDFVELNASLYA
jgi:hypothetical protein